MSTSSLFSAFSFVLLAASSTWSVQAIDYPNSDEDLTWVRYKNYHKCTEDLSRQFKATLRECQEAAIEAGVPFFQWKSDLHKCQVLATCDSPIFSKWTHWAIYTYCSVVDGSAVSAAYPCRCGTEKCSTNKVCTAASSTCEAPSICSAVDGSNASAVYPCACGTAFCTSNQVCTAVSNMCKEPAICTVDDGSTASAEYPCTCGTTICTSGQVCSVSSNTCQEAPTCSVVDGSSASTMYPCACGTAFCTSNQVCSASSNTCQEAPTCSVGDGSAASTDYPCACGKTVCITSKVCAAFSNTCQETGFPNSEEESTWVLYKNYYKCTDDLSGQFKATLRECQEAAIEAGVPFFQWKSDLNKCQVLAKCDSLIFSKWTHWAIYTYCSVVDGSAVSAAYPCRCGTKKCSTNKVCTASSNTCQAPSICSAVDGSNASAVYPCACGTAFCTSNQVCTASSNTCREAAACSVGDGSAASTDYPCACGKTVCTTSQVCAAFSNTCQETGFPNSEEESTWVLYKNYYKCTDDLRGQFKATLRECQEAAIQAGVPFFQWKSDLNKCQVLATCDSPIFSKWTFWATYAYCSVVDGSAVSAAYPCRCGTKKCSTNQVCTASSSTCVGAADDRALEVHHEKNGFHEDDDKEDDDDGDDQDHHDRDDSEEKDAGETGDDEKRRLSTTAFWV